MLSKLLKKTEVKRNLTISVIGTGLGQLIHLGSTPVISRLYSPADFGQYSLFLSFLGVFTAISLCKFDLAIIAAEENEVPQIRNILSRLALVTTSLVFLIFLVLSNFESKFKIIFMFLFLVIPFSAKFWMHRSILNKAKIFKRLSFGKIIENSSNGFVAIALGLANLKDIGLFTGKLVALIITWIYFRFESSKLYLEKSPLKAKEIIAKYINYPRFSFPAELIAHLNLSSSIFLFSYFFSSIEVGLIGLTTRVLSMPANFVSISFFDVFKQKAVADYKEFGAFNTIFVKFLVALSLIGIAMVLVIFLAGPYLFSNIFGESWVKAGIYGQYLSFFYAIRLIAVPLIFSFEITGRHYVNLIFQFCYLFIGVTTILTTYHYTQDDLLCIKVYSLSLTLVYAIHILLAYLNSKQRNV